MHEKLLNWLSIRDMKFVPSLDPVQQAQRDYLESRVLSAQPAELVEMLYQVAIQSLKKAIGYLKSGDALARAGEISTRPDGEIAQLGLVEGGYKLTETQAQAILDMQSLGMDQLSIDRWFQATSSPSACACRSISTTSRCSADGRARTKTSSSSLISRCK